MTRHALRMENAMPPQTIERRVDNLEKRVTTLEHLPSRVDALSAQISQLREEMVARISATEKSFERTLRLEIHAVSTQMRVLHEDVIARLTLIHEGQPRRRKPRT